jgi:murein DD-endopeptidase MepM/ murein hydrolase activator NlpD
MHKPLNQIIDRGNDPTGFGHFGAKRGFYENGKRKYHKGHDVVSIPGEEVFSMIAGTITKYGYMYQNALQFRYVEVTKKEYRVRLCYIEKHSLFKVGSIVCKGDRIAFAQDIAKYHNRNKKKGQALMKNHLHIEIYKNGVLIDPKQYLIYKN